MIKKNTTKKKLTLKDKLLAKDVEIELLLNEIEKLKEKNIKLLAEFDNFQRRTFEEKDQSRRYDGMNLIKKLIPVFDDIDRASSFEDVKKAKSLIEAINMIKSKTANILELESIYSFNSVNEIFDPICHEALLDQNSDTIDKGRIIEEYEKGYKYREKIIRHAKVVVSKGKSEK